MPSPMLLEDFIIDNIELKSNILPETRRKKKEINYGFDFDIGINKIKPFEKYILKLSLRFFSPEKSASKCPYILNITLLGRFVFLEKINKMDRDNLLLLNGTSILYGIARGIVSQITANSRNGKWILPTLNFIELIKEKFSKETDKKQ